MKPRDGFTDAFSAGFPNPDFVTPVQFQRRTCVTTIEGMRGAGGTVRGFAVDKNTDAGRG
jgi:hypothetical protein